MHDDLNEYSALRWPSYTAHQGFGPGSPNNNSHRNMMQALCPEERKQGCLSGWQVHYPPFFSFLLMSKGRELFAHAVCLAATPGNTHFFEFRKTFSKSAKSLASWWENESPPGGAQSRQRSLLHGSLSGLGVHLLHVAALHSGGEEAEGRERSEFYWLLFQLFNYLIEQTIWLLFQLIN